jgi:hypothetical protein
MEFATYRLSRKAQLLNECARWRYYVFRPNGGIVHKLAEREKAGQRRTVDIALKTDLVLRFECLELYLHSACVLGMQRDSFTASFY